MKISPKGGKQHIGAMFANGEFDLIVFLSYEDLMGCEIKKQMDTALKCFLRARYGGTYPTVSLKG